MTTSEERKPGQGSRRPPLPLSALTALERAMGGAAGASDERRRKAQELVYEAWEAASADEAAGLLKEALELDPRNVDALLMVAQASRRVDKVEYERLLRKVISIAADRIGEELFKTQRGQFWGLLETRPYMRARGQLAQLLFHAARFEEAVVEHEEMLELNTSDNQGIRYGLLACYLALNRLEAARELIERCEEERSFSAMIAWAWVLERYLAGDLGGAGEALREAREQNPYVEAYLQGRQDAPSTEPAAYAPGSREEAVVCTGVTGVAWRQHPLAVQWLRGQTG